METVAWAQQWVMMGKPDNGLSNSCFSVANVLNLCLGKSQQPKTFDKKQSDHRVPLLEIQKA